MGVAEGRAVLSFEWEKNAKSTSFLNRREYPFGDINLFTNENVSDNQLSVVTVVSELRVLLCEILFKKAR